MSVDMLGNLKFGSDHKEDLEGLSPSTALFLWNYEKQKMHGIFAGTSRPVEDTSKHVDYLYEVRAHAAASLCVNAKPEEEVVAWPDKLHGLNSC